MFRIRPLTPQTLANVHGNLVLHSSYSYLCTRITEISRKRTVTHLCMKPEQGKKVFAIFLLFVFAYFYCGNTCFSHLHLENGNLISHSHPFCPGSTHSHSLASLFSISVFNGTVACMLDTSQAPVLPAPVCVSVAYRRVLACGAVSLSSSISYRAPPAA